MTSQPKRRWQFGLRGLLALVTCGGVVLAAYRAIGWEYPLFIVLFDVLWFGVGDFINHVRDTPSRPGRD